MRVFAFAATIVVAVVLFVVGGSSAAAQSQQNQNTKPKKVIVTVKSGDSLSKIAKRKKTTYQRLFYANPKVKDPDVIHPGQKLRVPSKNEKLKKRPIPGNAAIAPQPQAQKRQSARVSTPSAPANYASGGTVWDRLAACESGGNWSINTGNGYYGGLQFSLSSWRGVGGQGYPHQASRAEQIARGERLRASGGWGHWPACAAKLGLL